MDSVCQSCYGLRGEVLFLVSNIFSHVFVTFSTHDAFADGSGEYARARPAKVDSAPKADSEEVTIPEMYIPAAYTC